MAVAAAVRLLIIDEVHLLNDERGPVIETLIARTQRQVRGFWAVLRFCGLGNLAMAPRSAAQCHVCSVKCHCCKGGMVSGRLQ